MTAIRIEYLFDTPGKSPEDVPLVVSRGLGPTSFLKVLDNRCLVEIGLILEFDETSSDELFIFFMSSLLRQSLHYYYQMKGVLGFWGFGVFLNS